MRTGSLLAPQEKTRTANSFFDHVLHSLDTRKRVLILGDSDLMGDLIGVLTAKRRHWFDVVGVLTTDVTRVGQLIHGKAILGTIDELFETVERFRVHTIAICVTDRRGSMPLDTLLDLKSMGLEVIDGHQLYERECGRLSIDELKPSALIFSTGFHRRPGKPPRRRRVASTPPAPRRRAARGRRRGGGQA